jgi:membrane protein YqaA with SNARE-associated domain
MQTENSKSKENLLKRLYNWTISWAETPYSMVALVIVAFAESSFFPIPPDVLLIPMVFAMPRRWWLIAGVCTLSSTVGGIFGWLIGHGCWELMKDFFFTYIPGFTPELFEVVSQKYQENAFLAIFGAALTPIPYKIFTIEAGVCNVSLTTLIIGSLVGRGGRFFTVALVSYLLGEKAKPFIDKYFNIIVTVFFVLLIAGFALVKYLI